MSLKCEIGGKAGPVAVCDPVGAKTLETQRTFCLVAKPLIDTTADMRDILATDP